MPTLTINAYTAAGAVRIVRHEVRKRYSVGITDVSATLRPRDAWVGDERAAAFETTDHAGQRNATYDVRFNLNGAIAR